MRRTSATRLVLTREFGGARLVRVVFGGLTGRFSRPAGPGEAGGGGLTDGTIVGRNWRLFGLCPVVLAGLLLTAPGALAQAPPPAAVRSLIGVEMGSIG